MSSEPTVNGIYAQIGKQLIAVTPESWDYIRLELIYCEEGLDNSCSHSISNPKCPREIVHATDDLLYSARLMVLHFKKKGPGNMWKSAVYEMTREGDRWTFVVNFKY